MKMLDPQAHITMLERELAWAKLKIQALEERWRKHLIAKYGPKSETLSDLQLELLDQEPGVTGEEIEAESRREPVPQRAPREGQEQRKPHPGRNPLPETLPRIEETIPCSDPRCTRCGGETRVIGYDRSEVLDREPAKWFVRVTKREKRSCAACSRVQMPPVTPRIVDKGLASDCVVIDTVIAKYADHLPLYRQEAMIEREAGVEISRATLDGWVMRVGELLQPVAEAMRQELLAGAYLQADETVVPVQMRDKRGADHQAYLWQYGKPGGATVFDFQLGRGREGPAKFLKHWSGILQTDGYPAYDNIGGQRITHVGCWAHARRKFVDAVKVNAQDAAAIAMVTRMDALFLIDREARDKNLSAGERLMLRREHATAWLDEIHQECLRLRSEALPKSALGQAVGYTLNQWSKLRRVFEHGHVELSNNLAENSMRPIALGRKNWLHVGSAKSGPKVAAILTVVESCRRLGVPFRNYLSAVLPGMASRMRADVATLTPLLWSASR
jgi:transposase